MRLFMQIITEGHLVEIEKGSGFEETDVGFELASALEGTPAVRSGLAQIDV